MMIKGYTLVEMMVVIALLSMVGVAVVAMFLTTARSGGKAGALAIVKEEGDYAITTMERYIHFAKNVTNCSGSDITITQTDNSNVSFALVGTTTHQITRDGTAITSTKVDVSSLSFTCSLSANGYWTVDISFQMANPGEAISETFNTKVVLRNKAP